MARERHPHPDAEGYALINRERARLERYLPSDLFELLEEPQPGGPLLRPYIHLAAARYALTTYLPRAIVRQALDQQQQRSWVRWVEGSLLFADLSGSTALAEQLSVLGREGIELVTEFLNHIFDRMITVIHAHDGDLVAFGGDALLVYFSDSDHSRTAVQAALALQEALHGYVKTVPNIGSFPMHLHVGIESGRMAFVSAGLGEAQHYCLLGSTVNAVATAEGLAGPGEVAIGPVAARALHHDLEASDAGDGYLLISALRGAHHLPAASPDLAAPTGEPSTTIPMLLDDLDRLSSYIPPVLLGRIIADPQRPQIEADLRPVTVIFAQVVGLEVFAEQLSPDLAAHTIEIYVSAMHDAIEQFGGVINKLDVADEGLKLVAIFGAPTAYEDHAERAARAALAMREALPHIQHAIADILNTTRLSDVVLRQRIGINLGTAFAGNVGSPARKEYTVMGDAVNVAARVMSKAAWGEIWCSVMAARAIAARMVCDDRGSMTLKGKAAPLRLFRLNEERDTPDVVVNDIGPLVGREQELTWLYEQLDQALAGHGRAVRIVGEAGVGKSRIAAELMERARKQGVRLLPAACYSYTAGIPYAAWGEWLKALCGMVSGDTPAERTAKLLERLRDLGPDDEEWLPLLGDLVRLDIPENRITRGLDPQLRQARRFDLLERLLLRAADTGPVLTLFEDLHWADPISLDLWQRVCQTVASRPLLLIGMHRVSPLLSDRADGAALLELRELSPAESAVLADQLAGELDLPIPLVRQLAQRAAGNPLFLAELLRAVADHREANPTIDLAQLSIDDLPDSLHGLLLSRIDRLDEISRSILRIASVIGQRIPFGVLQSIQPTDQKSLIRQLARLDSEELTVLERVEPERVHTFRHALIQEVAYQSMLYARRRELHGRIGEYLEQRYHDDLDDYYGLLAHHYRLSDRRDKAVTYLLRAGEAARANYANEEAIQYFRWAIETNDDEQSQQTWMARDAIADVFESIGRYDDALEQHAMIIAAPHVSADQARKAHRKRGSIYEKQGQYQRALEELDRAMTIATSGAVGISPQALSRTYADIAQVRQRLGEYDAAIAACEAGLAEMRRDTRNRWDELIEADLQSILGAIYGMRGDYTRSLHHFEHSLRAREAADDLRGMTISHNNLGYLWQLQGAFERALDHYRVVEDLASKIGLRYMLVFANANAAYALISLSRYLEAEQRCQVALSISRDINARQTTGQIEHTLGIIAYQQGRYHAALGFYQEALSIHRDLGSAYEEANTLNAIALTSCALGLADDAEQQARSALERSEALQALRLKTEALNALAEALLAKQAYAAAMHIAEESIACSIQIANTLDEAIALRLFAQAASAQGLPAHDSFEQSIAKLITIHNRFELGRTYAAYGQALAQTGNLVASQAYLDQAYEIFVAIGAAGELQRLPAPPS
jgi:class 3 adenylate cyclase/tetratricopeptide (TPR) repeat protein